MQDKNEKKVTEIYHNIISKANFPYSRAEFGEMMQDKDNAKYFYNTYKSEYGDNLLGAPDEDSFLDSLGMRSKADLLNEATPDIMQRDAAPAMDSTPMQANKSVATDMAPVEVPSMELPTAEDNLNAIKERGNELVQNNTETPKDSVLPQGGARILDAAPQKSAEQVISEYTPVERVVEEGHIIGEDKITDALMADNLIAQTDDRLAQWHKENDEFIAEYEKRMSSTDSNAHNLYSESFSPMQIFANRKSRKDKEFINANSAKYNELIRQRDAIQRTKETVETMKKYTDFDRSVAIGEEMSSMVDKGELADFDMKTLRDISDDKERLDALTDMYNQGRISEDTFNKILDLGDTSDKSGLWYGMFKTGKIEDFATLGLNELARNIDIADIAKRYNEGLPVNEDELTLLNVYNKLSQIQSQDRSFGFNAGMGMQQSLQFVLESLATGGVNAIGSAAKQGGKALLKRLGQNAVRQAMLTPVTPMMYNDYAQRVTNLYLSEDEATGENMDVTTGDKLGALYKSYVGTFAERFSETLGNVVGEAKLFGRLINNKGTRKLLGKAFDTMAKIADNPAYKATADLLAAGGITDIPGEFASEYSGNIINSIFTLDAEPLAELFDAEFFGQVALQSVMMGGMGNAVSFTVGSGAAALERRKTNKDFKQGIDNLSSTSFDNPALESLKGELIVALNDGKLTGEDGTLETGDVTNILSQMKAEIARDGNLNDRSAMRAVDNAVRIGTYKYGQDAAVMAIVQDKIGEYLHDDGNVYEVVDNQGNGYFILAESEDAVVVINRTTNEKKSIRKDFFQEGSIKQTKGSDWAMEQFLMNIDTWNSEDADVLVAQEGEFIPADKLDIGGRMFDVAGFNPQTGKYTVLDENGNSSEIDPNDEDVTPIYSQPVDQTETEQQVVNTAQEEDLSDSTEDNTTIAPEVQSDEESALNEPYLADSTLEEENAESIENEIEYDENGDPVWSKISPERGKQEIDSAFDEDEAKAFVADKIKEAEKAVKKSSAKKPKSTSIKARVAEKAQIKAEQETAQANLDYWNAMSDLYNAQPVEETPVEQTEQVLKNTSDSVLPEGVTPYTVGENIKQKYNDTPKAYGAEDTYTDADGNTYKGRWVVVESDSVTPSHNAETLQPNEGFPLTDKGRNVNDNDYSTKRGIVETMAANYDARALDEPVIVSEGAIVSGNNRTISGQIAAQNGTDTKYKEALPSKAAMRGVSAEELGKFKNPRLVFELAEPIEYTTETFAKFNRPRSKTKSPVDMAIAIGKQDTSRLVGQVLDTIGEVEKFSDLYQNQAKVAAIMKQVVESGIINQNEMPQFYTEEYGITDAGKDFIETLLVGSVINEDQIRILNSEGMKQYREKIASAMIPIARNMKFEDNIGSRLNAAIKYLKEARDAKTGLQGILLDIPMFDAKEYEDLTIFTALMLQRKPSEFRQFINNLNERLELGGDNLFGEQESAQSVLEDYKSQDKLTDNERETIRLAEQARESATQGIYGGVQGDGTNANNRGEGVDGSSISEGQKQSVDNGQAETERVRGDRVLQSNRGADGRISEYLNSDDRGGDKGDTGKSYPDSTILDLIEHLEKNEKVRDSKDEIRQTLEEISKKLNTKVSIYNTIEELLASGQIDDSFDLDDLPRGWYSPSDGSVHFYLPQIENVKIAEMVAYHEIVAHKGLEGLLGSNVNPVYDAVWNGMSDTDQNAFIWYVLNSRDKDFKYLNKDEQDRQIESNRKDIEIQRSAADEYIAHIAQFTDFTDAEKTIWKKVVDAIRRFINNISRSRFTTKEIDQLLKASYAKLIQNKSADITDPSITRNRKSFSIGGRPAGYSTNNMEMTDKDRLLYAVQDRMRPVKKIMDEVISRGGAIRDNLDPYSQEFLATSRASAEIEDFKNEKYEPLAKAIADAMKVFVEDMGMTAEDARKAVDDYLYARHAPERNKRICTNEIFEEGMKDIPMDKRHLVDDAFEAELKRMAGLLYDNQFKGGKNIVSPAGLSAEQSKVAMAAVGAMQKKATAISKETAKDEQTGKVVVTANNRSGMSDAEAEFIMQKYYTPQTQTALDEVSSKVKDCTDFTLDKWLEYGLISNDDYNAYKNQYEYYIPLRGWEDTEDIDYTELPSKAFNVASEIVSGNRKAEGRTSKAKDPLAYIASLAQSACISGNRNLIRQKAFNMVAQNEGLISDLAVIENTYEIYDDSGNIIGYSKVTPSKALFDQGRVKIIRDKDYRWHKTPQQLKAHQVGVMIDGVRHVVTFKGSLGTLAATAINGTHNDTRNAVIQGVAKATRFVSSNLTAKNVYFLGKNLMRDLGFGNFAYFVENGAGKTLKLNRYFLSAMKTAAMDAMGADKSTYSDAALYDEFKKNGGQTGYVQLESIDKLSKQMNRLIEDAAKNRGRISQEAVNAKDLLFETFDVLGKASENAMRFAIYKLEREAGSTARQAAIRAKEITVNFNRQGTKTKGFSAIYAFFNPAVQGTYRFAKLAKANPKRFVTSMASLMAIKFGLGLICEMFSGNGDEPEGERPYDRLSDYVKATNWVVPLSFLPGDENNDKFLLIPMPQSVRGPVHISDLALDVMYGKKDFGEAVKDYAMFNIGEFIPFDIDAVDLANDNPVGTMLQAAMPTVLRPWIEEALNRDFMGNPIYKEPFTKNQDYLPQHQMAFKSTSPLLVGASRFLNEVAGGSEYRSAGKTSENGQAGESWIGSFMDVNPASAEHILSGYFGGMFKPVLDVWDTMTSVAEKDVETDISSIAIVNQFIKGPSSKPGYKRFYQMRDEVELINNLRAANKKEGISNDIIDSNKYNQQILALYKEASEMINEANEAISMIEDKERIREIEEARDAIILQAASIYREICDNRDKENKEQ